METEIEDLYGKWERCHRSGDQEGMREWEEELADYLGAPFEGEKAQRIGALMNLMSTLEASERA